MEMLLVATRRNQIRPLLEARGKSIYWLAAQADMSYQAIHRLVNSEQIPGGTSYSTLLRVASALGVGVEDLEANT
jgi:hypothetical protein